jgi:hypothetical protein
MSDIFSQRHRNNATHASRCRSVCAAHTFIERLRWTNASVKAL